jgi:hypothetical protein
MNPEVTGYELNDVVFVSEQRRNFYFRHQLQRAFVGPHLLCIETAFPTSKVTCAGTFSHVTHLLTYRL